MYEGLVIAYDDPVICEKDLICFFLPANWEKSSVILSFTIFFIIFVASFKVLKVLNDLKVLKDP